MSMKLARISICLTFCLLVVVCSAQEKVGKFKTGITLGMSTTQVSGDNLAGFRKLGVYGGIFVSTALSDKWEGALEMNYIMKGSRKAAKIENGNTSYDLRLSYIELPILFRSDINKFTYEFGPSFGVLISHYEATNFVEDLNPRPFRAFELGGNVGISLNLGGRIQMRWRFSNSLIPVREHINGATFRLNFGQYHTGLNFLFQYKFG